MQDADRFVASQPDDGCSRLLIEAITDYAIYRLAVDGTITSWNPGAQKFKGYDAAEVIGRNFAMFYTPDDQRAGLPQHALKVAAASSHFESEGWRVRKDGSRFWASVVIDPIWNGTGELIGFAKITRDLTERKTAYEALRRSEEQFRLLVQNVVDYAIYLLDPAGVINTWNLGAERIKGYASEEAIGKHFSMFYTEDDRLNQEPQRALDVAARDGRFEKEGWRVRKDHDVFWAHVIIDAIRDETGGLVGFAKITRDMTEPKKARLAVERAADALLQSQKMEAVGQLTGGVAHDFNNILTAILGGLEIIQSRLPRDPSITPLLDNAIQSALRGRSLTQRMLAFARRQDLRPETIDLRALVTGMTELLERTMGPSITIETEFSDQPRTVHADFNQLELAILNLTMNARDAMPDGGTITIAAGAPTRGGESGRFPPSRDFVCLSVTDQGEGMDSVTLSRAMEPFFTTKGVGRGTGLGLSMVHGFAEQSGGQFILKSRRGEGTVAEIHLPVGDAGRQTTNTVDIGAIASNLRSGGVRQPVVLAVDDDRLALMSTSLMLNNLGYRVFTATSGQQALAIMRGGEVPDLVIIDHAMPGMNGTELIEVIRSEWPAVAIVFATPLADTSVQTVTKPFRQNQLAAAIGKLIPSQEPGLTSV